VITAVVKSLRVKVKQSIFGVHFGKVGPTVWNSLGNDLCNPNLNIASFGRLLKTYLFQQYSVH